LTPQFAISVAESLSMTPRAIMAGIFERQGIFVDPKNVKRAAEDICSSISPGFGDGVNTFDVFLSYRVASESEFAMQLFLRLKTKGIHAFLDKECLKNGEPWKQGFLTGLQNSNKFVAILSNKGLERVRDASADHAGDNVLLELETALKICATRGDASYILPLLVGEDLGGGLKQEFNQMSPLLYPDTITPTP